MERKLSNEQAGVRLLDLRSQLDQLPEMSIRRRRAAREIEDLEAGLFTANTGLVAAIVRRVSPPASNGGKLDEELVSEGNVGLFEAIRTWDPSRGSLANWAFPQIKKRVFAEAAKAQGLTPYFFANRSKVIAAVAALTVELGRPPSDEEVSERSEVPLSAVQFLRSHQSRLSLDARRSGDEDGDSLAERLVTAEEASPLPAVSFETLAAVCADMDPVRIWCGLRVFGLDGAPPAHTHQLAATLGRSRETTRLAANAFRDALAEHLAR